ncbi:MAG: purine-nucleoside phosphorylase [Lachnospiraceae bacterium]|nr:purine-nucleoside phosphorylase [Lachnospiraceae bacterium]
MNPIYEKLIKCKNDIEAFKSNAGIADFKPKVALVLGSGLGDYAGNMDVKAELAYDQIEGFPISTVIGHAGKFVFGYVGDVPVICMKGRVHFYEGYHIADVVLPIRLMGLLGAEILFLTNASGGIDYGAGELMLITDHISVFVTNPLTGANIDELGTRFPDMSCVYRPELNNVIRQCAADLKIPLAEGIYAQTTGPSFESPADVMMLKKMGASAVGMSTAVEAIAANHMGMKVCGISCVCNPAAGLSKNPLTHDEVQEAAGEAAPRFKNLVTASIKAFL